MNQITIDSLDIAVKSEILKKPFVEDDSALHVQWKGAV